MPTSISGCWHVEELFDVDLDRLTCYLPESGLTTSAGDPQVPGQKYLQVLHLRLRISSFPWIMADPGIDFGFLRVLADTCQFVIT